MHPFIERINEKPASHKLMIVIGTVALLSFLFWQFSFKAKLKESQELEEKIAKLDNSIIDERRRAANLTRLRELVKELDEKLQIALQELPDSSGIDRLIDSISDLARDAGLEITLFTRKEDSLKDFYAEVPVAISVEGTYHQVATFFDEVSHLDRIVNINQIAISSPKVGEAEVDVKVDCNAVTFRYLDEEERARAAKQNEVAAGKSDRRRR